MTTQETATATGTGESTDSPVIRREDPLGSIRAMAREHTNWGRWGHDDVLGTLNFIDAAKRIEAAALVKTGEAFSLSQPFDTNGPQKGWRRRTNPRPHYDGHGRRRRTRQPRLPARLWRR
ncbi:hypothetical protein QF050_000562 [Arthrobacter sp. SLBN-112]|nr:hypothetical protein [Arthrobacter sp. SLBN-112]